jgi:hypothetical protein
MSLLPEATFADLMPIRAFWPDQPILRPVIG